MKLGLLTAPFPRRSLEQVAAWAAGEGFEMLEVACWPAAGAERRRYAGTSHIDVARLDPGRVRDVLDRHGLEISSLAYYPNNLHPDDAHREEVNGHLRKVIDAAQRLEVGIVGTFVGNDKDRPLPENLRRFREIWPPLAASCGPARDLERAEALAGGPFGHLLQRQVRKSGGQKAELHVVTSTHRRSRLLSATASPRTFSQCPSANVG